MMELLPTPGPPNTRTLRLISCTISGGVKGRGACGEADRDLPFVLLFLHESPISGEEALSLSEDDGEAFFGDSSFPNSEPKKPRRLATIMYKMRGRYD